MAATQTLVKTRMDLPENSRQPVVALLNLTLATAIDLHSQVKQAHWTVTGPQFIALHKLFDELAAQLIEHIDTVAERITALAGVPQGTLRLAAEASPLPPFAAELGDGLAFVQLLADRYAIYAGQLRLHTDKADEMHDTGTADLFTGLSREADQALWFLEAHLR